MQLTCFIETNPETWHRSLRKISFIILQKVSFLRGANVFPYRQMEAISSFFATLRYDFVMEIDL